MTPQMNNRATARWRRLRQRGWGWHVFVRGVFRYGVAWGALMLLFRYLGLLTPEWQGLSRELPLMAAVAVPLGIISAWNEWRAQERRFAESTRAHDTPTA